MAGESKNICVGDLTFLDYSGLGDPVGLEMEWTFTCDCEPT